MLSQRASAQQSDGDADAQWQRSIPIGQIANIHRSWANKSRITVTPCAGIGFLGWMFPRSSESRLVLWTRLLSATRLYFTWRQVDSAVSRRVAYAETKPQKCPSTQAGRRSEMLRQMRSSRGRITFFQEGQTWNKHNSKTGYFDSRS